MLLCGADVSLARAWREVGGSVSDPGAHIGVSRHPQFARGKDAELNAE